MRASATAFTLFSLQISWLSIWIGCGILLALYVVFGLVREKKPEISLKKAFRDTFRAARANPTALFKFLLTEVCLMLICLTPLLLLAEMPLWSPLAFTGLCWFLVLVPIRANAAAAMQDCLDGGSIFSYRLAETDRWWSKAWHGMLRAVIPICLTAPLVIALNYAYRMFNGEEGTLGLEPLRLIKEFGNGRIETGGFYLLLILAGLILIPVIGIAFHSSARHAYALNNPGLTKGHHGKIILGWFCGGFVFMLPLWIALGIVAIRFLPMLSDQTAILQIRDLLRVRSLLIILGAGVLLTLPLIPLRSLMTAAMVHQLKDQATSAES